MRVTPTVRCIAKIFSVFAAAFSLAVISCAANDDSASLTIQMPGSSSSRAISSEGHLEALDNFNFSVYIRDSDNEEVEKYTNVAPGTKLTISALRAGNYKVAIRGIAWGSVMFYGAADAVVQGGVENTVGIKLEEFDGTKVIDIDTSTGVDQFSTIDVKISCKNGDSWTLNGGSVSSDFGSGSPSGSGFQYYYELDSYFFEPGFTYNIQVSVYSQTLDLLGKYTSSATATKDGIVFTVN
ncbi:MAG: hypothetical protein IKQ23_09315 [Treponema sp.]|nr:hypothetical protein [Treponema sp.]